MRNALAFLVVLLPILVPAPLLAADVDYGTKMWSRSETEHYSVITNIVKSKTREVGRKMELLRANLIKTFGADKSPASAKLLALKVDVVIFDRRTQFVAYSVKTGYNVPERSAGYFRSAPHDRKRFEIVTYVQRGMTSTLLHEGTHQLLHTTLAPGRPPQWLDEGVAVYFQESRFVGRKMKTGIVPKYYRKDLKRAFSSKTHIPLNELLRYDGSKMLSSLGYAESWGLVYYLVHYRKGAYHKKFREYIKALRAKEDPVKAFEKHFTKNIRKLERS